MSDKCKENKHREIWINLLNPPTYEEIGRQVYEMLMSTDSECTYLEIKGDKLKHRHIEITGS